MQNHYNQGTFRTEASLVAGALGNPPDQTFFGSQIDGNTNAHAFDEAAHEAQAPIPLFENPVDAAAAKLVFDNFYRRFESPHVAPDQLQGNNQAPVYTEAEIILLEHLKKILEADGVPVTWDDVEVNVGAAGESGSNRDTIQEQLLSNDDAGPALYLSPNVSIQDLWSVHSSESSSLATMPSDAGPQRQEHGRSIRAAAATQRMTANRPSKLDFVAVNRISEYWASAIENARACVIRDMSGLSNGLFSSEAEAVQYAGEILVRVTSKMDKKPSVSGVRDHKFTTDDVKLPSMIASVKTTILNACVKAAVDLTEPKAPITEPNDIARRRGFRLLALTSDGRHADFDEIKKRVTDRLRDHAFCHSSPELEDLAQPLAYDIAFDTFFVGKKRSLGQTRSYAKDIKDYHDTYGSESPLIPFVSYLPIEALAMCFTTLKYTLDLRRNGHYEKFSFSRVQYLSFYTFIRGLLYKKAKSDKAWAKRYLLDSCKAFASGTRVF